MAPSKEVTDFVSGYKKYWEQKKVESENTGENKTDTNENGEKTVEEDNKINNELNGDEKNAEERKNETELSQGETKQIKSSKKKSKNKKTKKRESKIKEKDTSGTSQWEISLLEDGNDVEDIFNKLEEKLEKKLKQKSKKLKKLKKANKNKSIPDKKKNEVKKIDLSLPSQSKKPVIDEEMIEEPGSNNLETENVPDENSSSEINRLKNILDAAIDNEKSSDIDPQKFLQVKTTNLNTAIPDILTTDENEENVDQREVILEAFEDDDIAEEFKKEKESEVKKDTPGDIDLNLPGWGSWGGTNIVSHKRRRRFILKMPPKVPRKDDNKGSLIINEKAQSKVKSHMVSEVPFPFKSVKDYEASLRAPMGNTFVPETAFRKFIEPAVITKMGAIIEPITKSVLMGEKKV